MGGQASEQGEGQGVGVPNYSRFLNLGSDLVRCLHKFWISSKTIGISDNTRSEGNRTVKIPASPKS